MELVIGAILEGKVTGITKFGAFVTLEGGKSGLVHISEVANAYVNDVHEHVALGQTVKVKVMNITDDGKINLSIKRAEEPPAQDRVRREQKPQIQKPRNVAESAGAAPTSPIENQDFEDRLKRFMQESDSRIADNRIYSEHKQRNRRR